MDTAKEALPPTASLRRRRARASTLVALNFKVPFEFRQQCKVYAAANGVTLTDLLMTTFRHAGIVRAASTQNDD
jgi:hypothetical protein